MDIAIGMVAAAGIGIMGNKVYNLMNSAQNDFIKPAKNLTGSAQNDIRRTTLNFDKQLTHMRVDSTEIIRAATSRVSDSIDRSSQNISHNCNLITNTIFGLGACIALSLLLYHTDFLATSVRFGIWTVLAYFCYCMVKTYLQHSHWLEKSYSNEHDDHYWSLKNKTTSKRYPNSAFHRRVRSTTHRDALFNGLIVFMITVITYASISYIYYGNYSMKAIDDTTLVSVSCSTTKECPSVKASFEHSILLTSEHQHYLNYFYQDKSSRLLKWKLIYRGSTDGLNAAAFHTYCDNKGETFTILSSTNGYLFGGYVDINWTTTEHIPTYNSSTRTFLFSLMNSKKIPATKYSIHLRYKNYAIVNDHLSGPIFGVMEQPDIGIYDSNDQFRCQVNFPSVYKGDGVMSGFPSSSNCIINEIEVFTPIFKEVPMNSTEERDFNTSSSFLVFLIRRVYLLLSYVVHSIYLVLAYVALSIYSLLVYVVHSIYLFLAYVALSIYSLLVYFVHSIYSLLVYVVHSIYSVLADVALSIYSFLAFIVATVDSVLADVALSLYSFLAFVVATVDSVLAYVALSIYSLLVYVVHSIYLFLAYVALSIYSLLVYVVHSIYSLLVYVVHSIYSLLVYVVHSIYSVLADVALSIYSFLAFIVATVDSVLADVALSLYSFLAFVVATVDSVLADVALSIHSFLAFVVATVDSVLSDVALSLYSFLAFVVATVDSVLADVALSIHSFLAFVVATVDSVLSDVALSLYSFLAFVVATVDSVFAFIVHSVGLQSKEKYRQ